MGLYGKIVTAQLKGQLHSGQVRSMASLVRIFIFCLVGSAVACREPRSDYCTYIAYPFNFVSRETWGARPATSVTALQRPVPYVLVHHSYEPPACITKESCKRNMRLMQDMHQIVNGWHDIGYNFAVGGEGSVYEGRGWEAVGAHAVGYNVRSIGICMIGDFVANMPPTIQLQSLKQLIELGIQLGYISPDYKLIGHRQVSATECPGEALYSEISTWEHFTPTL